MRLMLSVILSFSFFIAPHSSNATGVPSQNTAISFSESIATIDISAYSDINDPLLNLVHKSSFRSATNKFRCCNGGDADTSNLHIAPLAGMLSGKRLDNAYSFCIPIGQKLLYPKHYFW